MAMAEDGFFRSFRAAPPFLHLPRVPLRSTRLLTRLRRSQGLLVRAVAHEGGLG
jgi:hypothetical protein